MRRHNSSSFRLPCHSYAEYQVISDYSDTSNDESHSTGVTNPCGVLHPRSSFKRSHDAPGWARPRMSLRSNGQPGPRARCVKSHDTGRGRRERGRKIDGTDKLLFTEITFISPRTRATSLTFHENPQRRSALQWPRGTLGFFPSGPRLGEDG